MRQQYEDMLTYYEIILSPWIQWRRLQDLEDEKMYLNDRVEEAGARLAALEVFIIFLYITPYLPVSTKRQHQAS